MLSLPAGGETMSTSSLLLVFCNPEMSNSRLGTGKSSLEEDRPILMGQSLSDKEAWVDSLKNYLTIMKERAPDVNHPTMEWIN